MTLLSLWLPILLSAVLVFFVSSILHMMLPIHRKDYSPLPQEDALRGDMRSRGLRPGNYAFPCPQTSAEMRDPEILKKYDEGPVGFLHVMPDGPPAMGKSLVQWFVYSLLVGVFVAYLAQHTIVAGAEYWTVFRVTGATAFLAYAMGQPQDSIWKARHWSTTFKHMFDGLVYSLMVAGSFAGFWPGAA